MSRSRLALGVGLTLLGLACSRSDGQEPRVPEAVARTEPETVPTTPPAPIEPAAPATPGPVVPAEALARRRVVLEIEQMAGTPPLQTTQTIAGAEVSLQSLFGPAGFDIEVRIGRTDLPRLEEISLGQLHGLMMESRLNRAADLPADVLHLQALVVTRDHEEEDALGVMFDFGDQDENDVPREAFAIYADAHQGLGGDLAQELLLTAAHELGHCFNLHHADWEGSRFERDATVEGYSLTDTVRWHLSERSLRHLRQHNPREVEPGGMNLPFGWVGQDHLDQHQGAPDEDFRILDGGEVATLRRGVLGAPATAGAPTAKWGRLAKLRGRGQGPGAFRNPVSPLRLTLSTPKTKFVVGERVDLLVELLNSGDEPLELLPLLDPAYGFLEIIYRAAESDDWVPFEPVARRDGRGHRVTSLAPGDAIYADAPVFFGAGGWSFEEPGSYELVADYAVRPGDSERRVASAPIQIEIVAPQAPPAALARRVLSDARGRLGREQGLYLIFQGGDHLKKGATAIRELSKISDAPQASSANLALARNALEPSTSEGRGKPSADRSSEAQQYLNAVKLDQVDPRALAHTATALSAQLAVEGKAQAAQVYRDLAVQVEKLVPLKGSASQQIEPKQRKSAQRHRAQRYDDQP